MNVPESLTQKWLRQNINPYSQKERVYADIDAVLSRFPTLRPKSDVYTFDDGRTQLLLCVHGLLPISFRQASYNIPIAIWVNREYPRQPPIAYVVPTNDMLVKAGKYIDVSGRCNVEYIQHWERKSEGCNLSALLEAMQEQFSREPPVYAKPKDTGSAVARPPQAITGGYAGRPPPPLPTDTPPVASQSIPLPNVHADRPILPPKPGSSTLNSVVQPRANATQHAVPALPNQIALATRPPPSLPPHPMADQGPPQYRSPHESPPIPPNYQPHSRNVSTSTTPGQPPTWVPGNSAPSPNRQWTGPPAQSNPPPAGPIVSPVPLQPPVSNSRSPASSTPTYYSPPAPPPPLPPTLVPPVVLSQPPVQPLNLLDEESFDPQFSSTDQTPSSPAPPPRPPNPELLHLHAEVHQKLLSELASLSQVLALDAERLRAHQTDLLAGEPAIRDEMARLEAVRDVCQNVAGRMRGAVDQAERNVAELRRKGDPEVDELVCSTTIVHNQLVNLVAEDNAIEDTIYHLHRALNTGRIDLERFLRTSRVLAEEQFMKRALIEKIQTGMPMGLSMGSGWP